MLKKLLRSKLFLAFLLVAFSFIVSGYLLSDAFFFKRLIRQNNIVTPEDAFAFVIRNTGKPSAVRPIPPPGGLGFADLDTSEAARPGLVYSPREMLTKQRYLWCDQSSILVAAIVRDLGYEPRIVDFIADDGISHHTILEVKQQGIWKTYDTTYETQGLSYQELTKAWPKPPRPVPRPYIGPNWIVRNNFYVKHLASWARKLRRK